MAELLFPDDINADDDIDNDGISDDDSSESGVADVNSDASVSSHNS